MYRRRSEDEMARLQSVVSPGGELAFSLPRTWSVNWTATSFTARGTGSDPRSLSGGFVPTGQETPFHDTWLKAEEQSAREAISSRRSPTFRSSCRVRSVRFSM